MKADVHWVDDTHSVLCCRFSGEWDWKVFYATIEQPTLFNEPHDPCLMIDLRGVPRMPIDMVLHLKRAVQLTLEVKGMTVLIATSAGAATMYQMLTMVYKPLAAKMRLVSSEEEAYAVLGVIPEPPRRALI
jgi:hypothetical protein